MSKIFLTEILDYQDTPPTIAARFWWSEEKGLTCDNARMLERLKNGIPVSETKRVYPADGRAFFDALPLRFNGFRGAQVPVEVNTQGGENVK